MCNSHPEQPPRPLTEHITPEDKSQCLEKIKRISSPYNQQNYGISPGPKLSFLLNYLPFPIEEIIDGIPRFSGGQLLVRASGSFLCHGKKISIEFLARGIDLSG